MSEFLICINNINNSPVIYFNNFRSGDRFGWWQQHEPADQDWWMHVCLHQAQQPLRGGHHAQELQYCHALCAPSQNLPGKNVDITDRILWK